MALSRLDSLYMAVVADHSKSLIITVFYLMWSNFN